MQFPTQFLIDRERYVEVAQDGSLTDRAEDGTPRIRRLYSQKWYEITIVLVSLAETDVGTVEQFYEDNLLEPVEFVNPIKQELMQAFMTQPPQITDCSAVTYEMTIQMLARYL